MGQDRPHLLTRDGGAVLRAEGIGLFFNLLLFIGKWVTAYLTHSDAILSDAVHSLTDVAASCLVLVGLFLCALKRLPALWRRRLENLLTFFLCAVLCVTAVKIGCNGLQALLRGDVPAVPPLWALLVTALCVLVKEGLFRYVHRQAVRCHNAALLSESWHHRSDALCSLGVFAGVLGVRLGLGFLDALVSLAVCFLILYAVWEILHTQRMQKKRETQI